MIGGRIMLGAGLVLIALLAATGAGLRASWQAEAELRGKLTQSNSVSQQWRDRANEEALRARRLAKLLAERARAAERMVADLDAMRDTLDMLEATNVQTKTWLATDLPAAITDCLRADAGCATTAPGGDSAPAGATGTDTHAGVQGEQQP